MKRAVLFLTLVCCAFGDEPPITRSVQAVVNSPVESVDWWANIVEFYRADDKGHVVLVGAKGVCTKGPLVKVKEKTDHEITFTTEPMAYATEIYGYIITDKNDNYVAHVPMKKKLKEGEELKVKIRFAKAAVPPDIISAKYRCINGESKPVEGYYAK